MLTKETKETPRTLWFAICPDSFGGYGILASGDTREEATEALLEIYAATSKTWNNLPHPRLATFEELDEEWGVRVYKMVSGLGYFGDTCEEAPA